jgi:hypothetical protein
MSTTSIIDRYSSFLSVKLIVKFYCTNKNPIGLFLLPNLPAGDAESDEACQDIDILEVVN